MKKAAIIPLAIFLFFAQNTLAQSGPGHPQAVVCPFEWKGDIWPDQMGIVLAEEIHRRIRWPHWLQLMPVEKAKELLYRNTVDDTWAVDAERLRFVFRDENVLLAVIGEIEKIYIIRDINGTMFTDVEVQMKIIDLRTAKTIYANESKYRGEATAYISAKTPFDRKTAVSIINRAANFLAETSRTALQKHFARNPFRSSD